MRSWTAVPRTVTLKAIRSTIALGGLAVAGACADGSSSQKLTAPESPAFSPSITAAGVVQICVDPASPAGIYSFAVTNPTGVVGATDNVTNPVVINTTVSGPTCGNAFVRTGGGSTNLNNATVTVTTTAPAGGSVSYTCSDDVVVGEPLCNGFTAGTTTGDFSANSAHGTLSTFLFVAPPPPPPPPAIGIPMFVIGDVEPHAVGETVNFWGAQWWKNNFMSGDVSNGVASFKGYASSADNFCGGEWTSRPGNSAPPVETIPVRFGIIVTSTVKKSGADISGNIVKILIIDQDLGYKPNPGHRGNGLVVEVACP